MFRWVLGGGGSGGGGEWSPLTEKEVRVVVVMAVAVVVVAVIESTWTHFLFHFLTGPLKTAAVTDGLHLDEARPNRNPTPSIFITPEPRFRFSGIAGFLGEM